MFMLIILMSIMELLIMVWDIIFYEIHEYCYFRCECIFLMNYDKRKCYIYDQVYVSFDMMCMYGFRKLLSFSKHRCDALIVYACLFTLIIFELFGVLERVLHIPP